MSKRYREALEEVETPASRRPSRHHDGATDTAAGAGPSPPVPAPAGDTAAGAGTVSTTTATTTGGVATLVRPCPVDVPGPRTTRDGARDRTGDRTGDRTEDRTEDRARRDDHEPLAFTWRGRRYVVTRVIGHWREEEGWWRRPDGEPIRIEQSDLWRVEATPRGVPAVGHGTAAADRGVYELACRGGAWRLDRVWD